MIKNPPLISVIIPCHNAEETIEGTLRSVLSQTYNNIEIICIDDCSTDDTLNILLDLEKHHSKISVFSNDINSGVGITRNNGIGHAKGEFLSFIDADDYFEPNLLSSLCESSIDNNSDISQCLIRYVYDDRNYMVGSPTGIIKGEHCAYRIDLNDGLPFLTPQVWNKLYRKSLFDDVNFVSMYLEDAQILPFLTKRCNIISCIDNTHVHYNKRYSTLTGNVKREVERLPNFFGSIITSIKPYFENEYLDHMNKWGAKVPTCCYANTNNFLKSLISTKSLYSKEELQQINVYFDEFSTELINVVPIEFQEKYLNIFNGFCKVMEFDFNSKIIKSSNPLIKRVILWMSERSISILDRLVPKRKDIWLFTSWARHEEHTLDNPRALFEKVKNDRSIRKVVILNSNKKVEPDIEHNIVFYPLHSVRAILSMLRCGKIFTGYSLHAVFGYRKLGNLNKRKIIQLWHGIPIKKVGLAVSENLENHWSLESKRYAITIANSVDDKSVMEKSFSPKAPDKVKLTGLPRHDFLAMDESELPKDYKLHLDSLHSRVAGRKLILFAPTWRYNDESPCAFGIEQLKILDDLCKKTNTVFGIRVHANMLRQHSKSSLLSDNIIYLNDYPDVNVIMRETDVLITDYSSLYLDYMVTNRPVLLYTPDIDIYKLNRGFNYSSDDFIPHEFIIDSFDCLIEHIHNVVINSDYVLDKQYEKIKNKFHKFDADGNNASRVLDCIK
ncbi:hypothetical protein A9264_15255 [Vibrio sp. UCD-FRSSP16_10]|uniref:bifunctional glycosyltransferase/CDP-glycerol:glycerophosphate glycerophosphotransferase n=1 Tax=unclassified Vibrio TaxID=2614977 RepID=UPI0007FFC484|nr:MULTISPECIES: CDP-glycerol glycerophosphotransferase family protein [unclassified Vibrio]OBT13661.1 hypothetical protein A9260_13920 [Vibrio sp. UCD-FRSSP16_30]OBT19215.1 hypothetical protein A9264_15255 [Vibrio sp. UCD-FRSSP16_10]